MHIGKVVSLDESMFNYIEGKATSGGKFKRAFDVVSNTWVHFFSEKILASTFWNMD